MAGAAIVQMQNDINSMKDDVKFVKDKICSYETDIKSIIDSIKDLKDTVDKYGKDLNQSIQNISTGTSPGAGSGGPDGGPSSTNSALPPNASLADTVNFLNKLYTTLVNSQLFDDKTLQSLLKCSQFHKDEN
ncbi:Bacterial hemolysins domain-containing protein [Dioscorea alata]|uniref:Bacterial hemolysins domain-containing protein n=1 Tax=Dioscorea alata TaxID=55571 RepID=A0ACB7UAI5_DIOAL|nr:Bacterial hemolysins domain-containing protein [Dioscorea alata]